MTDLVKQDFSIDSSLKELEVMQAMTSKLLQMKHFQKIGDVGVFAILQKAKSIGIDPLDALNGGMYFVNGKVELSANTMNFLIRQAGHSIIKDEKSNKDICILRGKRADNGDTFTCSFSIADAKQAGIYKNVWQSYPEDMLFARALTRLARQLFPDVCKGCYIEGEIPVENLPVVHAEEVPPPPPPPPVVIETVYASPEEVQELIRVISQCNPEKQAEISDFVDKQCDSDITKIPIKKYRPILKTAIERMNEYQKSLETAGLTHD